MMFCLHLVFSCLFIFSSLFICCFELLHCSSILFLIFQGAPESILDRCDYVRIGKETVPLTDAVKEEILHNVQVYGTGMCLSLFLC